MLESQQPPISILFASFLGYNPIRQLLGPSVLGHLSAASVHLLTSRGYFPALISDPFRSGLHIAFAFSITACLIAAAASWSRGRRYVAAELEAATAQAASFAPAGPDGAADAEAAEADAFLGE
jgi:hypothetical protein